jgi:hypothetical protein
MISISQFAASVLYKTLQKSKVREGQSLRLAREKERFVLQVDSPIKTDRVIKYKDTVVLMVNRDLENELGNARIDIEETTEGPDLIMRRSANPNTVTSSISGLHELQRPTRS